MTATTMQDDSISDSVAKDVIATLFGVDPEGDMDPTKFYGPRFNLTLSFIATEAKDPSELAILYLELPLGQIIATREAWEALVERLRVELTTKHKREHRFVPQEEAAKMIRNYQDQLSFEALAKSGYKFHEA